MEEQYNAEVMSVKEWFITTLILAIPMVGLIMLFVWGFGAGHNPNKANWAKAMLLWYAVLVALTIFIFLIFGAALFTTMSA